MLAAMRLDLLTPTDVERMCRERGVTPHTLFTLRNGLADTIFGRWKMGMFEPTLRNYRRMVAALLTLPVIHPEPELPVAEAPAPPVETPTPAPKKARAKKATPKLTIVEPSATPQVRQRTRNRAA